MPKPETNVTELAGSYPRPEKDGEEVRAEFSMFRDRQYFSIRGWYKADGDTFKPGRNGINLPVEEKTQFLKLVAALFPDDVIVVPPIEAVEQ